MFHRMTPKLIVIHIFARLRLWILSERRYSNPPVMVSRATAAKFAQNSGRKMPNPIDPIQNV